MYLVANGVDGFFQLALAERIDGGGAGGAREEIGDVWFGKSCQLLDARHGAA
jgi:hypothetical protein